MANKKNIDWDRVEIDYRAGKLTLREIGAIHNVTHTTIRKKAEALGWTRNLVKKIDEKTKELVAIATAESKDSNSFKDSKNSNSLEFYEEATINATAKVIADVILSHRAFIIRYRSLAAAMLNELEIGTENQALFSELGELLHSPDEKGVDKLNELYHKVISLPSRVDSLKKLSEVLKTLIGLEREAFNIGTLPPEGGMNLPSNVDPNESWELIIRNIKQDIQKFTIVQS